MKAEVVYTVTGAMIAMLIVALIPAGLWFGFDDTLAALVGVPELGTLGFWEVWAAIGFVSWMLGSVGRRSK